MISQELCKRLRVSSPADDIVDRHDRNLHDGLQRAHAGFVMAEDSRSSVGPAAIIIKLRIAVVKLCQDASGTKVRRVLGEPVVALAAVEEVGCSTRAGERVISTLAEDPVVRVATKDSVVPSPGPDFR